MNLLLLLSALLSALTGVGGGVRDGRAVQAVAERSAVAAASVAAARVKTARPSSALPTLAVQAQAVALTSVTVHPIAPIFASRRRE